MQVIVIYEENHGVIGVAENARAACRFLVKENWFGADDDVWHYQTLSNLPVWVLMEKERDAITDEELVDFLFDILEGDEYETCFNFRTMEVAK